MCAVKTGKAQREQMFSALPLRADNAQCSRHVRFVPTCDIDRRRDGLDQNRAPEGGGLAQFTAKQ